MSIVRWSASPKGRQTSGPRTPGVVSADTPTNIYFFIAGAR